MKKRSKENQKKIKILRIKIVYCFLMEKMQEQMLIQKLKDETENQRDQKSFKIQLNKKNILLFKREKIGDMLVQKLEEEPKKQRQLEKF